MRESWTDDRLDDFRSHVDLRFDHVDQRFEQVDQRFDRVEAELRAQRIETRAGFDRVDARFEAMEVRIDGQIESVRRLILQVGGGLFGTLAVGILTVLGSHL